MTTKKFILHKKHNRTDLVEYRLVIEDQDKGIYTCTAIDWEVKEFYMKLFQLSPDLAEAFDRLIDDVKQNAYNEGYQETEENNAW